MKNKLYPWSDYQLKLFHNSAYCYFGNFGEIPNYSESIQRFLNRNLEYGLPGM